MLYVSHVNGLDLCFYVRYIDTLMHITNSRALNSHVYIM